MKVRLLHCAESPKRWQW